MEVKKNKEIFLLAAIILIGLFLNTFGLKWGLPEGDWHWDEKVRVLTHMIKNRTLNPHYFGNPALQPYLIGICLAPYLLIIKLGGGLNAIQSWNEIPPQVRTNIFIIARSISVFLSIATGYLTYLIGKKIFGRLSGIIAFLFLILSPGFVTWSHFSTVDITFIFLFTLSTYHCIQIIDKPKKHNYLLAGIFAGLAVSTKYTGLYLGLLILIAHFCSMVKQYGAPKIKNILGFIYSKYLFIAIFLLVLCFFAINPFILVNLGESKRQFAGILAFAQSFQGAKYVFLDWRVIHGLNSIFGTPALIAGALSVFFLVIKPKEKKYYILYIFISIMLYLIYVNSLSWSAPRYLIIVLPFMAIAVGHFCTSIMKINKSLKIATAILISGILIYQATLSVCVGLSFANDPKVQAKQWVMSNISPDEIIHSHGLPAYVDLHLPSNYRVDNIFSPILRSPNTLMRDIAVPSGELEDFLTEYSKNGPDYIITSPNHYKGFSSNYYYAKPKEIMTNYYDRLISGDLDYKLVASFENKFPLKVEFLYPINSPVEIYKK